MFMNVKLPGDDDWSRVTPSMAKLDLDTTAREESTSIMKRISTNKVTGPRLGLATAAPTPMAVAQTSSKALTNASAAGLTVQEGTGRRAWTPRGRRGQTWHRAAERRQDPGDTEDEINMNNSECDRHDTVATTINDDEFTIKDNEIHFVLTNARSLLPKITALIDMIHELDLTFAANTEMWFKGGMQLKQELTDIELAADIKFVCRNRPGRGAQRKGGGALAFRSSLCNFKERKIRNIEGFELLCATGNAGKVQRKLVVFVAYLPPGMRAGRVEQFNELLSCEIPAAKVAFKDPIIVVCGDMNGKSLADALVVDDELDLVETGPTRGASVLDLVFTNVNDKIVDNVVLPPLETETGMQSDHRCVKIGIDMLVIMKFQWLHKNVRKRLKFEEVITTLTDRHFPI